MDAPLRSGASTPATLAHRCRRGASTPSLTFVAADVCRCLNLNLDGGTTAHTARLAADEKRLASRRDLPELFSGTSAGTLTLIAESGMYKIVLRANDSPAAAKFQDWVTKEVLPAIRKDGAYVMGEEKVLTGFTL